MGAGSLGLVAVLVSPCTAVGASGRPAARLCAGREATLDCLSAHFYELFGKDEDRFWTLLHTVRRRALRCQDVAYTAKYLNLIQLADASIKDDFNEAVLEYIRKPKCLLEAVLRVDEESRRRIAIVLRSGSDAYDFDASPVVIRRAFGRYKEDPKYREFLRPILED